MEKTIVASLGIIQQVPNEYILLRLSRTFVRYPNQWSLPGAVVYSGDSLNVDLSKVNEEIISDLKSRLPNLESTLVERAQELVYPAEFEVCPGEKVYLHVSEREPNREIYVGYVLTMTYGFIQFNKDKLSWFSEGESYLYDKLPPDTTEYTKQIIKQHQFN